MKTCLTIAGSDSSGGAGIQADLKTFAAHRVYGMSAITAITAQNTLGVHAISTVEPVLVGQQIQAVFDDIKPDAVKIGMLANHAIIETVAEQLASHKARHVVLDPVMIATSGDPLLNQSAVRSMIDILLPQVDILTPNASELLALCAAQGIDVNEKKALDYGALKSLSSALFESLPSKANGNKVSVLSKGGHVNATQANDLLISGQSHYWLNGQRINTNNSHGTGCTLSAAICAQLAKGETVKSACQKAKHYLTGALAENLNLGKGNGPINHCV